MRFRRSRGPCCFWSRSGITRTATTPSFAGLYAARRSWWPGSRGGRMWTGRHGRSWGLRSCSTHLYRSICSARRGERSMSSAQSPSLSRYGWSGVRIARLDHVSNNATVHTGSRSTATTERRVGGRGGSPTRSRPRARCARDGSPCARFVRRDLDQRLGVSHPRCLDTEQPWRRRCAHEPHGIDSRIAACGGARNHGLWRQQQQQVVQHGQLRVDHPYGSSPRTASRRNPIRTRRPTRHSARPLPADSRNRRTRTAAG
jgi:hypothetical protein